MSGTAVDVAHHKIDIVLSIVIKRCTFGAYFSYILMVLFAMGLLSGTYRIIIINIRADDIVLTTKTSGFWNSPPRSVIMMEKALEKSRMTVVFSIVSNTVLMWQASLLSKR